MSRKFCPTNFKFFRHVSGSHNSTNKRLSRHVEKNLSDNFKIFRHVLCAHNSTNMGLSRHVEKIFATILKFFDMSYDIIIRRNRGSSEVSRKFCPTNFKIIRHVSGSHKLMNQRLSRRVEKILYDHLENISTRLRTTLFDEYEAPQTCRENFVRRT